MYLIHPHHLGLTVETLGFTARQHKATGLRVDGWGVPEPQILYLGFGVEFWVFRLGFRGLGAATGKNKALFQTSGYQP